MSARTLPALFEERVASSGDAVALRGRVGDEWRTLTWTEWYRASLKVAAGLNALGVAAGDRVAILSRTRIDWPVVDFGVALCGAVSVPLHDVLLPRQLAMVLADADVRVAIVEDPAQLAKVLRVQDALPALRHIVFLDEVSLPDGGGEAVRLEDVDGYDPRDPRVMGLPRVRELGSGALASNPNCVLDRVRVLRPDSIACVAYTGGATGRPRGAELTHGNFVAAVDALSLVLPTGPADVQLIFLPLSLALGRITYLTAVATGAVTALVPGPTRLAVDMRTIEPTVVVGVPRVFEKVYARLVAGELGRAPIPPRALQRALDVAERWSRAATAGRPVPWLLTAQRALAERALLHALRAVFGGRLRFAVCAGAPLAPELAHALHGAGLKVLEGYGLTESTAIAAINRPDRFRFGTAGEALPGIELRLDDDGEILVRGPTVMRGYRGDPDATAAVLVDGWLRTGDLGEFVDGFLRVTGRKSDVLLTSAGRQVAPSPIESALRASPYVAEAVVVGDGRPAVAALVTLEDDAVAAWARENAVPTMDPAALRRHPAVYQLVRGVVDDVNAELPPYEQIRRFAILDEDFGASSGELTPGGTARRRFIAEKYRGVVDALYAGAR